MTPVLNNILKSLLKCNNAINLISKKIIIPRNFVKKKLQNVTIKCVGKEQESHLDIKEKMQCLFEL